RRVRPPRLKPATHAGRRTFETGLFALGIAAVAFGLGRIALEVNVIFETLILSDVCRLVLEVGALFLGVALLTMGFGLLFTAGTVPLRHMEILRAGMFAGGIGLVAFGVDLLIRGVSLVIYQFGAL